MWQRGETLFLGATVITAFGPNPDFGAMITGGHPYNSAPADIADHLLPMIIVSNYMDEVIKTQEHEIKKKHATDTAHIDSSIDKIIKNAGGKSAPMNAKTPPETVSKELSVVSAASAESRSLANTKLQEAKSFFGENPIKEAGYDLRDFYSNGLAPGPHPNYKLLKDWATAYNAYKTSQVYLEMANRLKAKEDALTAITAEQSRIAAEAEAQRVAAEAEAKRIADEAEAKRVADEQARVAAEAQRVAQQQAARQAVFRTAGTLAMPANAAAITVSGQGLIQVGEGAGALAQAIADAIAALGRIAAAGPGAYIAAFVSLGLYSPATADGSQDRTPDRIRYGFGLKAEQLGLAPGADLQSIALAQGTVELPWRLTNEAKSDRSVISVVSTDGVNVPKAVPVRAATLNPTTGLYEVVLPTTIPDQPPITLTWTPLDAPGSENPSSTTTPAVPQEIPVYTGTTLQPITVEAEPYPGVTITPDDLITWFPAESGIAPVYVMFSEPLDSGVFTRRQLQKKFDSHKEDFGFEGQNATNQTLTEFRDKILTHLSDPATIEKGTFHSEPNSKVYFNSDRNLVVIVGADGMFISGWHLEPGTRQYKVYIDTGVL